MRGGRRGEREEEEEGEHEHEHEQEDHEEEVVWGKGGDNDDGVGEGLLRNGSGGKWRKRLIGGRERKRRRSNVMRT